MLALALLSSVGLAILSPAFDWAIPLNRRPIVIFTGGLLAASTCFALLAHAIVLRPPTGRRRLGMMIAVGMAARLMLLLGPPILEDDGYRYLWDGALVAHGLNPYAHPPSRFLMAPEVAALLADQGLEPTPLPAGYETLARDGRAVLGRINNPHLTTIYPPLAQAGFALGHHIAPLDFFGWKLVVLGAEALTLVLLLGALTQLGKPLIWAAIYWLNPLVLKEFANSAHMDALMLPALAGAAWSIAAGCRWGTALALAAASAVKLWPLLLIPPALGRGPRYAAIAICAGLLLLLLLLPQLVALGPSAGLSGFAEGWERNAFAFSLAEAALGTLAGDPGLLSRLIVAALVTAAALHFWWRDPPGAEARLGGLTSVTALLLLLAPVGYPWYATWLLPFLAVRPDSRWFILIAFAPAYYLRFHFQAQGQSGLEAWLPPLLSFGPVWASILWTEGRKRWPRRV
jgi:alpha-1,6-mannosyltransferase